jgi:hypothetical protein
MVTNSTDFSVATLHQIKVGETLTENIDGHAARTDSPEFVAARATVQKIVATLDPNPYGPPPIQAHHVGSQSASTASGTHACRYPSRAI